MTIEYERFQEGLQQKVYEKLCTLDEIKYTYHSRKMMMQDTINNFFSEWFDKYDLLEVVVPLPWWKDWLNQVVRCLPRWELSILFKYDSKLVWVEK